MAENDLLILIPARMASTRLPGKPLADIAGHPMIVHVLRRAQEAALGPVAVATDSREIAEAVEKAGGQAVMTRADHVSGSDRIFEALNKLDPQGRARIVVNVQGDLPTLSPRDLHAVLEPLADPAVDIATLAAELQNEHDRRIPSIVKVTGEWIGNGNKRLKATNFTRLVPPARVEQEDRSLATVAFLNTVAPIRKSNFFHHIGLYAYRRDALKRFVDLPPSPSEMRENLEQLRAMDDGMRIDVAIVDSVPLGVDTPEELALARAALTRSSRNA